MVPELDVNHPVRYVFPQTRTGVVTEYLPLRPSALPVICPRTPTPQKTTTPKKTRWRTSANSRLLLGLGALKLGFGLTLSYPVASKTGQTKFAFFILARRTFTVRTYPIANHSGQNHQKPITPARMYMSRWRGWGKTQNYI